MVIYNKEFHPLKTHSLYLISEDGDVYSTLKKRLLGHHKNSGGYPQVFLKNDKGGDRWERVHSLVARNFVDNPHNYKEINHKDGNKLNNHYSNLQWCTRSQNQKHAHETGLMPKTQFRRKGIISEEARRKMSESKSGTNHPKYKGGYTTPAGHFHTAQEAADANGLTSKTVHARCKNPMWIYFGWWAGEKAPSLKERPKRTRSVKWYQANK